MAGQNVDMTRRDFVAAGSAGAVALGMGIMTIGAHASESEKAGSGSGDEELSPAEMQRQGIENTVATDDFEDVRFTYDYAPEATDTIAPADASGITWDIETEVLCCGYGATGACAALRAAESGAQVLIIEKDTLPGGSMARCGGGLAGAGTSMQKALGIEDNIDDFYAWLKTSVGNTCPDDILRAYAEGAGDNIEWVNELNKKYNGHDAFVAEYTDTYFNGLSTTGTDYASFGIDPETVPARSHWIWIGDNDEGISYAGPELFDPLYQAINDDPDHISVMYETALQSLIQNPDGAIIGAVATDASGKNINIKAKKGVVLGCGGFPYGEDMQFCMAPKILNYRSFMNPNCTGDGIRAAMKVGAGLMNMTDFQPLENAYAFVVGTTKDEVLYPMKYNTKWDDVFAMWDRPVDDKGNVIPGEINLYGATFAETHGGVIIDVNAEVMDAFNKPIPRLFASGCDTGTNPYGAPGHYPGCGTYVGFAMVFGSIAGRNVAKLDDWDA